MKFNDLIGKTIKSATAMKKPQYNDVAWLRLEFTDGTECIIESSYGGYTGDSEGEYPCFIGVTESIPGLVDTKDTP